MTSLERVDLYPNVWGDVACDPQPAHIRTPSTRNVGFVITGGCRRQQARSPARHSHGPNALPGAGNQVKLSKPMNAGLQLDSIPACAALGRAGGPTGHMHADGSLQMTAPPPRRSLCRPRGMVDMTNSAVYLPMDEHFTLSARSFGDLVAT